MSGGSRPRKRAPRSSSSWRTRTLPSTRTPTSAKRRRKRSTKFEGLPAGQFRLGAKRALAAREFALGVEALEQFVREEPLRRVHECCFAVLAPESEPVDPRL